VGHRARSSGSTRSANTSLTDEGLNRSRNQCGPRAGGRRSTSHVRGNGKYVPSAMKGPRSTSVGVGSTACRTGWSSTGELFGAVRPGSHPAAAPCRYCNTGPAEQLRRSASILDRAQAEIFTGCSAADDSDAARKRCRPGEKSASALGSGRGDERALHTAFAQGPGLTRRNSHETADGRTHGPDRSIDRAACHPDLAPVPRPGSRSSRFFGGERIRRGAAGRAGCPAWPVHRRSLAARSGRWRSRPC